MRCLDPMNDGLDKREAYGFCDMTRLKDGIVKLEDELEGWRMKRWIKISADTCVDVPTIECLLLSCA